MSKNLVVQFDTAVFYLVFGVKPEIIRTDSVLNARYKVRVPLWLLLYRRYVGFVPFRRFLNCRQKLKERSRAAYGLPKRYTGKQNPFTLADLLKQ